MNDPRNDDRQRYLIILRHGRTKENELGIIQGKSLAGVLIDPNIDPRTIRWCKKQIKGEALILSSTASRCDQWSSRLAALLEIPRETTPLLMQRGWGEVEGKSVRELGEMFVKNAFTAEADQLPRGAEPLQTVHDRVRKVWKYITEINAKTVLIVTHDEISNYLVNEVLREGLFKRPLTFEEGHLIEFTHSDVTNTMLHRSIKPLSEKHCVILRDDAKDFLTEDVGTTILKNRGIIVKLSAHIDEQAEGIIIGDQPFTDQDLRRYPRLKVIARFGKGVDNVRIRPDSGIWITNTPGCNERAVAEFTMGQILNLTRDIHRTTAPTNIQYEWLRPVTPEWKHVVVGVVGLGAIGQELIKILQGTEIPSIVWTFHPEKHATFIRNNDVYVAESFMELCVAAHVVTLHVRGSKEAEGLLGIRELEAMSAHRGYLINTARASIVDYEAVKTALHKKRISGAALDVWPEEPVKSKWLKELTTHPRVIATPHIAGRTRAAIHKAISLCAYNVAWVLMGREQLATCVSKEEIGYP